MKILVIKSSSMGDIIHALPVAHDIRQALPEAELHWVAEESFRDIPTLAPAVSKVHVTAFRRWRKAILSGPVRAEMADVKNALRAEHYDVALDIQGLFLSGMLTRMSRAPRRIGIHERHEGNFLFMTEMAPDIPERHKIRRYMTALAPLGIGPEDFEPGLVLKLPDAYEGFAEKFFADKAVTLHDPQRPLLLVNTRTTWPDKNWPPEFFGRALANLPENIQIVFTGAPSDQVASALCLKV